MLRFATENAPEAEFVLGDARNLDFPPTFDGAVSQFGSLNHVMNLQELRSVFEQVHRSLLSDGRFLFDLNTEEGFLARWNGSFFGHAEDDHAFIAGGTYDPEHKIGRFSVTMFFLRDEGWRRSDVVLTERAYAEAESFGRPKPPVFKQPKPSTLGKTSESTRQAESSSWRRSRGDEPVTFQEGIRDYAQRNATDLADLLGGQTEPRRN